MSFNVKRQKILSGALVSIAKARRDGGVVAADEVAGSLLEKTPDCSIPLDELRDEIARLAVANGLAVELGPRPKMI